MRAWSEHRPSFYKLFIPACALREHIQDASSKLTGLFLLGVAWISPQLRTSNDHSCIVGVP